MMYLLQVWIKKISIGIYSLQILKLENKREETEKRRVKMDVPSASWTKLPGK